MICSWMIHEWQSIPSTIARSNRKRFASTTVCHPSMFPPNHDLATDCGKLLLCLLFWCLVKHRGLASRFWVWRCPNEFTSSHEHSGHYQLPFLLLQSFQRIVVLQAGAKCRQGELLIRFLAFQIKRRIGGSGRTPQIPLFSWFSYYPPTFLPRTSTSFGFANRESSRCQMLSHRLIVNALQDRHCLMDYWFVFDLLLAPWPKGVRLCLWSTSVVRGMEMLHASFSPCWLFKLKKSGFWNRHLLSQPELLILGANFGVDSIHQLGTRQNCMGIVWFISWAVGWLKWNILHRQFLSLKPWDAINCSRRPGDPHGGWNLGCSLDFQLLEPGWGGQNLFFWICKTTKIHWSDLVRPAITCTGFGECREYRLSSDPPPCVLLFGAVLLCTYLNVCLTIHPSSYLTICLSIQPSISSSFVCTFWVHSNDVFKSLISWLGPVYCFKQVRILRLSRMAKLLRAVPELVCEPRGKPGWNLVDAGHMEYHFNFRHENDMFLLGLLGFETRDIVCVIVD